MVTVSVQWLCWQGDDPKIINTLGLLVENNVDHVAIALSCDLFEADRSALILIPKKLIQDIQVIGHVEDKKI